MFELLKRGVGKTLVSLNIHLPFSDVSKHQDTIAAQCPDLRLDLPHLRKLRVVVPVLLSVDFLLPLVSLRVLEVVLTHKEELMPKTKNQPIIGNNQVL